MNDVTFLAALSAGIASFVSPCVLPLVPAYLSYISGASQIARYTSWMRPGGA